MAQDSDIKGRIKEIKKTIGGENLSERSGLSIKRINNTVSSKEQGVSACIIRGLQKAGVSIDWLLSGEGDMFLHPTQADRILAVGEEEPLHPAVISLQDKVDLQERMIALLEKENARLEQDILSLQVKLQEKVPGPNQGLKKIC